MFLPNHGGKFDFVIVNTILLCPAKHESLSFEKKKKMVIIWFINGYVVRVYFRKSLIVCNS